jgi:hypothetical protein
MAEAKIAQKKVEASGYKIANVFLSNALESCVNDRRQMGARREPH